MSTISNVSSGVTQRPDFSQMEQALFNKTDVDGDGSINQDELQGLMTNNPRLAKAFSSLAANSNGSPATAADVMKKLDTDGDGKVSAAEFTAGLQAARATMKSHGHHHAPPPPPPDQSDDTDSTSSTDTSNDLKSLLEQFLAKLQKEGSKTDGTSTSSSSTSVSSTSSSGATDNDKDIKNLLTEILEKMKQQSGYAADGTQSANSSSSAAIFQVTA